MTTGDVVRIPRSKHPTEFARWCGVCGGPLVELSGRRVPVWVHARHRQWLRAPHGAEPLQHLDGLDEEGVHGLRASG